MKKCSAPAAVTAATYLLVSIVWIALTHSLVCDLSVTPEAEHSLATINILGFVTVSSVMLFFLVRRHLNRALTSRCELLVSQQAMIRHLAQAGEWRDDETGDHVLRVATFAYEIAKEYGLCPETCDTLRLAATTHDIGKIGVPDSVVLFAGKYSAEQRARMQAHTLIGGQILRGGAGELVETARRIAVSHHEWWDGSGYPAGLIGVQIPLEARITAIADVFDALVSPRRYKEAWTWDASVEAIVDGAGRQFDPGVVAAFVRAKAAIRQAWEDFGAPTTFPYSPDHVLHAS